MSTNIASNETGFSVVELLIAMIVIGIVFGSFVVGFTSISNINKRALDVSVANGLAFAKVQEYENKPYSNLPATTPTGSLQQVEDFSSSLPTSLVGPRSGLVYINTISNTLKQVVVTIQFGASGDQRTIQYGDFIQASGLGR